MEKGSTNPLRPAWEEGLESKSFEELAKIIANKQDYDPEYIEMVSKKLLSHSSYSEEKVNAIIEQEEEKRMHEKEQAEKQMSGWLMFFMFGLIVVSVHYIFRFSQTVSQETDGTELPLIWFDAAFYLGLAIFAAYTFWGLLKRKPNAIRITQIYLGFAILLNTVSLLQLAITDNTPESFTSYRLCLGIIVAILWLLYFKYSKRIEARYPTEERR